MPTTTFTVSPGSDDQHVTRSGATYPPSGAVVRTSSVSNLNFARYLSGGTYRVGNVLLAFDTSSIPDASHVTAAHLRLYRFSNTLGDADGYSVTAGWYAWDGASASDHSMTAETNAHAGTPVASLPTTTGTGFNLTLQGFAANINKTGKTKLRLHLSGGQPTGVNQYDVSSTEGGNSPQLVVTYQTNLAPLEGAWVFPPTPQGANALTAPTFTGTMPHDASEAGIDSSTDVQLEVYKTSDLSSVYNQVLPTTQAERDAGQFSRSPVTLLSNTEYQARFRHRDTFGVWSTYSAYTVFSTGVGPTQPTNPQPSGKINAVSGYNYSAVYGHQSAVNVAAAQIRLHNSTGSTQLYDSGEVAVTAAAPGSTVTVNEASLTAGTPANHPTLAWATGYRFDIRFKDANGSWSAWTPQTAFNTNSAPNAPTNLQPSGDAYTPTRTLTASVSDPDGDAITGADIEIANADTNVVLTGYPKSNIVSIANGVATFTVPSGDVTLGTRYKWRARATDGNPNSPGAWSDYAFYRYQNVPDVSATVPDPVTTHAPVFNATYNHLSSLARTHRRTVLQRLDNGAWTPLYDSGWVAASLVANSAFQVAFPVNTVRNHQRYRVKEYARDTGSGEGETPWYEFTTDYEGPPALNVTVAQADPTRAEISLQWEPSTLTPQQFAGIEIRKEAPGERTEIVHVSYDPALTGYVYSFPRSNVPYALSVRQIENEGVEQVEGDWTTSTVTVDYAGYYFVKDVEDPSIYVKYRAWRDATESYSTEPDEAVYRPWGSEGDIVLTGRARPKAGELEVRFLQDYLDQTCEQGYGNAKVLDDRRNTVCLLSHYPERGKTFAKFSGPARFYSYLPKIRAFAVGWRKTNFSEDYYRRNP